MQQGQTFVSSERRDHRLLRLLHDSHGATQTEYALIVALILVAAFSRLTA